MQEINKTGFYTAIAAAELENTERVAMGLNAYHFATKEYASIAHGSTKLVEYYFAGMLFGFVQDDHYYLI